MSDLPPQLVPVFEAVTRLLAARRDQWPADIWSDAGSDLIVETINAVIGETRRELWRFYIRHPELGELPTPEESGSDSVELAARYAIIEPLTKPIDVWLAAVVGSDPPDG